MRTNGVNGAEQTTNGNGTSHQKGRVGRPSTVAQHSSLVVAWLREGKNHFLDGAACPLHPPGSHSRSGSDHRLGTFLGPQTWSQREGRNPLPRGGACPL